MTGPTEAITAALREHREEIHEENVCICGWHANIHDDWPAHVASVVVGVLTTNGWALVQPPTIAYKGPHDTDASMLRVAADKAESAKYPVGGSNVGRAVADILRQVAAAVSPTQKEPEPK